MNNLIERFIAAMEKIADALSAPAVPLKPCSCAPKVTVVEAIAMAERAAEAKEAARTHKIAPAALVHVGPEHIEVGYKGITDYEALKKLCAERGIEVPPRTKGPTLVKNLKTWDAVQIVNKPAVDTLVRLDGSLTPVVQEVPPAPEPTPASQEADPFVEETPEPPAARTFEETLVVLQALMKVRGNAYVSAMIKKHTGFEAYKDVKKLEKPAQDAALTALYNEATQELN